MISDAKLKDAIRSLAELNIGFYFLVAGSLEIRELEGEYAVDAEYEHVNEQVFDNLDDAIECFVALRRDLQCGADYEFDRQNVIIGSTDYEWYSYVNRNSTELFFVPIISGVKVPVRIELSNEEQAEMVRTKQERESSTGYWDVSTHLTNTQAAEIIGLVVARGISGLTTSDHFEFRKDRSLVLIVGSQ